MPEHATRSAPELDQMEQDAIDFFLTYEEDIQLILRNPRLLMDKEEWGNFEALISHLDRALSQSVLSRETLLFRGMGRDIAGTFLFMLDVRAGGGEGDGAADMIPHLVKEPGYTLFSTDPGAVLRELPGDEREMQVIFAYLSRPGDSAVILDEEAGEMLYPRKATWVTTGSTTALWNRIPVTIISIEMTGCGEEIA
jgi:hypothetical protein